MWKKFWEMVCSWFRRNREPIKIALPILVDQYMTDEDKAKIAKILGVAIVANEYCDLLTETVGIETNFFDEAKEAISDVAPAFQIGVKQ